MQSSSFAVNCKNKQNITAIRVQSSNLKKQTKTVCKTEIYGNLDNRIWHL